MTNQSNNPTPIGSPDLSFEELKGNVDSEKIEHKWRLFDARHTYAWNYFDFHAKQRTTMFNFFLLFTGLFVNAYVTVFKENLYLLSTILALFGAVLTVIFVFLERRNEELVHIAENVLESLESDVLFSEYNRKIPWPRRRNWLGRMERKDHRELKAVGILLQQVESQYSHGKWLPWFQYLIVLAFLFLAIFPWVHKCFF